MQTRFGNSPQEQLTLEAVNQKFILWRSTRAKVGKIPEELWQHAFALIKYNSVSKVASTLGISYNQIKYKAAQLSIDIPQFQTKNNFVEINIDDESIIPIEKHKTSTITKNNSCTIKLKRADVASLKIHDFNELTAIKFAESFLK